MVPVAVCDCDTLMLCDSATVSSVVEPVLYIRLRVCACEQLRVCVKLAPRLTVDGSGDHVPHDVGEPLFTHEVHDTATLLEFVALMV